MSDLSGRKKQLFRFWFPPWRSSTQAPKQPKPPPIPPQLPPPTPPSPPPLDDARKQWQLGPPPRPPSPSQSPSRLPPSIPSSSSPERRELIPPAEPPRAQVDSDEEKTRTEFESERVTETETSSFEPAPAQLTEEMKPGMNMEDQKDSEARLEKIQEEKPELDSETQQLQQEEMSPTETKQVTEEFQSKEGESAEEEVSEEKKKASEPKISLKLSDLISPVRTTEQETPEDSKNGAFKESIRQKSAMKERRITISTTLHVSSHEQKELKDGLSRLVQKHQNKLGNEQGVNIITIASENQGAVMIIGHETHPGKKVGKGHETKDDNFHKVKGNESIIASINSNVQGINSSIMDEIKYRERSPGVHMTVSTKPTAQVRFREKAESKKATSSISAPQKLTYEPNIRRRCLRALFLESSDEDEKGLQKARRHGCRFRCDDKSKGKVEDSGASRKI